MFNLTQLYTHVSEALGSLGVKVRDVVGEFQVRRAEAFKRFNDACVMKVLGEFPVEADVVDFTSVVESGQVQTQEALDSLEVYTLEERCVEAGVVQGKFLTQVVDVSESILDAVLVFPFDLSDVSGLTIMFTPGAQLTLSVGPYVVTNPGTGRAWGIRLSRVTIDHLRICIKGVIGTYGHFVIDSRVKSELSTVADVSARELACVEGVPVAVLPDRVARSMVPAWLGCSVVRAVPVGLNGVVLALFENGVFFLAGLVVDARVVRVAVVMDSSMVSHVWSDGVYLHRVVSVHSVSEAGRVVDSDSVQWSGPSMARLIARL